MWFPFAQVKRAAKSRFMAGAHVFPGGIMEPSDSDPAWRNLINTNSHQKVFHLACASCQKGSFHSVNVPFTPIPYCNSKTEGGGMIHH